MSEAGNYKCKECGKAGYIVSVEVITTAFPVFADKGGEPDYEPHGKDWDSYREHYCCTNCDATYSNLNNLEVVPFDE